MNQQIQGSKEKRTIFEVFLKLRPDMKESVGIAAGTTKEYTLWIINKNYIINNNKNIIKKLLRTFEYAAITVTRTIFVVSNDSQL